MGKGLICVLFCIGCATSPDMLDTEYGPLIRSEWAIAQAKLESAGVEGALVVPPEICTWIAKDGKIASSSSPTGWANGTFNPVTYVVRWNTETPGVIRHEAGHAILRFLDFECSSCYEHDCGPCPREEE